MITDADLVTWLRAKPDDIETLRRLERAAISLIQKKTGRYFGPETEVTEYVNWRGWPMALSNEPIDGTLTSFKSWDGTAFSDVDASSYYLQGSFIYWNSRTPISPLTIPTRYQVVYQAGYAQLDDENAWEAPENIQQAVLLLVGHWYENREAVVVGDSATDELPLSVSALLDPDTRIAV